MPSRQAPSEPQAEQKWYKRGKGINTNVLHADDATSSLNKASHIPVPDRTLSPASESSMNSIKPIHNAFHKLSSPPESADYMRQGKAEEDYDNSEMASRLSQATENGVPHQSGLPNHTSGLSSRSNGGSNTKIRRAEYTEGPVTVRSSYSLSNSITHESINGFTKNTNSQPESESNAGGPGQSQAANSVPSQPNGFSSNRSQITDNPLSSLPNGFSNSSSRPNANMAPRNPPAVLPLLRNISSEFGLTRLSTIVTKAEENVPPDASSPQQYSAIGKSNLGKSGRVIERLMTENDNLKRDLTYTRLQADESRNEAKMAQGRMELLHAEIEQLKSEIGFTETIMKRKDRQIGEYKINAERDHLRVQNAQENERTCLAAMDRLEVETKSRLEIANNMVLLAEGRYNSVASHWNDQRKVLDAGTKKLRGEISAVVADRTKDRAVMEKLEETCEQQTKELDSLRKEKEGIARMFEAYKLIQEDSLKDIKAKAAAQQETNERTLVETRKVLGELKWALAVKDNVRGAS